MSRLESKEPGKNRKDGERMPRVLNKHIDATDHGILVDRTTKWGNPYKVGSSKWQMGIPVGLGKSDILSVDEAVKRYEWRLRSTEIGATLMEQIHELRGKDLVCWCAPLPCHANILLELANK